MTITKSLAHIGVEESAFHAGTLLAGLLSPDGAAGVAGWADVAASLANTAYKIHKRIADRNAAALEDMIARARQYVPVDTGRLLNGIGGEDFGDYASFTASAVHGDADYARYVEFGTAGGVRGRKRSAQSHGVSALGGTLSGGAFDAGHASYVQRRRERISYRSHPGTKAQPFFFPAVNEAIGPRNEDMQNIFEQAGHEEGF
jgi:hypothetical protein